MSGGGWKEPFYKVARQDSRVFAELGRALGWDGLRDEGKYNQKNPGHAVGKVAQYAATMYLGGLLGGGEAAAASGAAGQTAEMTAAEYAAEEAAAQAAAQAAQQGVQQTAQQGLLNGATQTGTNSIQQGLLQQSTVPVTDLSSNFAPVSDQSSQAGLLDKARLAFSGGGASGGSSGSAAKAMMMQQGLGMVMPKQGPQQQAAPPMQGGQQGPLPTMYGRNEGAYGTSAGNSVGTSMPLTEEQKRKLRSMGVKI